MMSDITRRRLATIINTVLFLGFVVWTFPKAHAVLRQNSFTVQSYQAPADLVNRPPLKGPPATAVPILLYHGVLDHPDEENTPRPVFIAQMEALKRAGYQTITVAQLEAFYHGQFTLPPKPIMITFDDGRKDSFYPTDEVLRRLGFRATMFVATIRADVNDPFYLSWDELAKIRDTGRWDIEAHGRRAHEHIPIDATGTMGRFLSSRIYYPGRGLESIPDFENRVNQDYLAGIADLRNHLGITPRYFAVPLSDYGTQPVANYPAAVFYNKQLVARYFQVAFIEGLVYDRTLLNQYLDPRQVWNIYNYADTDPLSSVRLEPKEMDPQLLLRLLDQMAPHPPSLDIPAGDQVSFNGQARLHYGQMIVSNDGLHLRPVSGGTVARVEFGSQHWSDYQLDTTINRLAGRSLGIEVYDHEQDQGVTVGLSDSGVYLEEQIGDQTKDLRPPQLLGLRNNWNYRLTISVFNRRLSVMVNGRWVYRDVPISSTRGSVTYRIWDPRVDRAEGLIKSLSIKPIAAQP